MIHLTRLNHTSLVLNAELIEHIEMTPDTVISLTTGQKLVVRETADEIIDRVIQYRRHLMTPKFEIPSHLSVNEIRQCFSGDELNGGRRT
jgi:flagellar protein FlbD